MNHSCPPFCHLCPGLDDDVMPSCLGTAALGEEAAAARIAALEARIAALEAAR